MAGFPSPLETLVLQQRLRQPCKRLIAGTQFGNAPVGPDFAHVALGQRGQQAGLDERGFAAAGGPQHRQKMVILEPRQQFVHLLFAPEEDTRFVTLEGAQAGIGVLDFHASTACRNCSRQ